MGEGFSGSVRLALEPLMTINRGVHKEKWGGGGKTGGWFFEGR